jgi:hypothetical protein
VDDVEWHLAEQMADRLRMRIEEFESLKLTGQNPSGSAQRLSSFVVYWLTLKARCNSYVEFHYWNSWLMRFPLTARRAGGTAPHPAVRDGLD